MPSMPCKSCQKNSSLNCGRCKGEYYCSKDCQKSDWKFHKRFCPKIATFVEKREKFEKNVDRTYEDEKEFEMDMKNHASFVSTNPWPEESVIMDFIYNQGFVEASRFFPRNSYVDLTNFFLAGNSNF